MSLGKCWRIGCQLQGKVKLGDTPDAWLCADHARECTEPKDTEPPEAAPPTSRSPVSVPDTRLTAADMTLRDYFAACALQGMLADRAPADYAPSRPWGETLAGAAYVYADAMLEARKS